MTAHTMMLDREGPHRLSRASARLEDLERAIDQETRPSDWPLAVAIADGVPVYDGEALRAAQGGPDAAAFEAEFDAVFDVGPGALAIRNAVVDVHVIDTATALFEAIIDEEAASGGGAGDHFAKPGANNRIWNALQKHALRDPENFALYYATPAIAAPARAWLGDGYQVTAQVNRVNPGGAAQSAHRDYHLGFMAAERMALFPAAVHALSPRLTLQGGLAHGSTPIESGPTQLLPYSQRWREGYLAAGDPDVRALFEARRVQIPLEKGDAVFFNPALLHAAGENRTTDTRRMVNLFQISSAFGRAMETVDRETVAAAIYPALLALTSTNRLTAHEADDAIAAAAEGYAFPTNLDRDPPVGGVAPETDAELLRGALAAARSADEVRAELEARRRKRRA